MIANKIKINLCLVSIKLFIVRTILCATFYNLMCQIITCLFVILLIQLFAILFTMEIFKPRLFSSHAKRLHTSLTELLLLVVFFVFNFFIRLRKQSDEGSWSRTLVVSPSREPHRDFIIVCEFSSHCLLLRSLSCLSPSLSWWCCWITRCIY